MIPDPVTTRWAEALFEVAKKANALDAIAGDTQRLSAEVASPKVDAFLYGSGVSQEQRLEKFGPLLSELHPQCQNFVKLLFERRRQDVLKGIGEAFRRRLNTERGLIDGVIETPRELSNEDVEKLQDAISKRLDKNVVLSQRTVPELIGGIRVIVGARLFDATVKGRLDAMREKLMSAPLPVQAAAGE